MAKQYYTSTGPTGESIKTRILDAFNHQVEEVMALREKLNTYVQMGYDEVPEPAINYQYKDLNVITEEMLRLKDIKAAYKEELSRRASATRKKLLLNLIIECPEGKLLDIVDESNFYNFSINERRDYLHARKYRYPIELKTSKGKIYSIIASPEEMQEMLGNPSVLWGFDPATTKCNFI